MNAVPELIVGPSDRHPRTLRICWDATHITVGLYGPSGWGSRFSFAMATHREARLDLYCGCLLWLGSACFDLTEAEARQICAVLEPHGLRIETTASPLTAAPAIAADREDTVAAGFSPGGDGGTTPPATDPAGGALECENSTFAQALTCGEWH